MALFDQPNQQQGTSPNLPMTPPPPPRPPAMTPPPPQPLAKIPTPMMAPPAPLASSVPSHIAPPVPSMQNPAPVQLRPGMGIQSAVTPPPIKPAPIPPPPLAPTLRSVVPTMNNQAQAPRPSTPPLQTPVVPKAKEPEDIFAGTGLSKGGPSYPHGAEAVASIAESPARGLARKLVRLIFFALGAAAIVIAGYFGYQYFMASSKPVAPVTTGTNTNENTNVNTNENIPVIPPLETNTNTTPVEIINPPEKVLAPQDDPNSTLDTDADGLTDYQEVNVYRTNPALSDTDADSLSDRDEVLTWNTDPLNPDTDGDTFKDGDEVKNGYNPLGAGKLMPPITQ